MIIEQQDLANAAVEEFVAATPGGRIYHLPAIQKVIQQTFGHRPVFLVAREGSTVKGVLPLTHMKSRLFGNFLISVPFFNYGGVCSEDEEARSQLLAKAIEIGKKLQVSHIELRHDRIFYPELQQKSHKVAMILELPDDAEVLWKSFKSKLRSQIRRPEKDGVEVKIGRSELVDEFYSVFAENMRDLGTPVYTRRLFENMLETFPESSWLVIAHREGEPLAAGFLLGYGDMLEIPWASSLRRFNRLAPNMLMYWHALKHAVEQGYKNFDFGRSTPGEGTYKFKAQWGAQPLELHWEYWMAEGKPLPDLSPKNAKFDAAIRIWQKIPVPVTRLIGPPIVRNIP